VEDAIADGAHPRVGAEEPICW